MKNEGEKKERLSADTKHRIRGFRECSAIILRKQRSNGITESVASGKVSPRNKKALVTTRKDGEVRLRVRQFHC